MALWAAVGSGGAIAGQLAGGVITDLFGWRWIFLINVPIGLVTIAVATRLLPESRDDDQRHHLDVAGGALLAATIAVTSLGLARVGEHGLDPIIGWHVAASGVLLIAFAHHERRHPDPLVRLGLLRLPGVSTGNSVLALLAGSTAGALFFSTLYLQVVLDYSPADVGFAFAPVTLIVLAVSPLAGRIVTAVGVRPPLMAGTTLCAIGFLYLAGVDPAGSYLVDVLPGLGLVALGNGLAFAPTMIAATSGVADHEQGVAAGMINTAQELGTALGLAALAAIAISSVTPADGDVLAAVDGYQVGFVAATALAVVALGCAWRAPRHLGRTAPTPDKTQPEPVPTPTPAP